MWKVPGSSRLPFRGFNLGHTQIILLLRTRNLKGQPRLFFLLSAPCPEFSLQTICEVFGVLGGRTEGFESPVDCRYRFSSDCREIDSLVNGLVDFSNEGSMPIMSESDSRVCDHAHHVPFHQIESQRYFLNSLIYAKHAFLGFSQDNVGLLVVSSHYSLHDQSKPKRKDEKEK